MIKNVSGQFHTSKKGVMLLQMRKNHLQALVQGNSFENQYQQTATYTTIINQSRRQSTQRHQLTHIINETILQV